MTYADRTATTAIGNVDREAKAKLKCRDCRSFNECGATKGFCRFSEQPVFVNSNICNKYSRRVKR